jgi:hypothetical protein
MSRDEILDLIVSLVYFIRERIGGKIIFGGVVLC